MVLLRRTLSRTFLGFQLGAALSVAACGANRDQQVREAATEVSDMNLTIEQAQAQLTDSVMSLPDVVGVAIGDCDGQPCIKVLVTRLTQELAAKIPSTYAGYTIAVDVVGDIRARGDSQA